MPSQSITARGHENVHATHQSTLELTTDDWLTPAGDCILGIDASVAPASFDPALIAAAQSTTATIQLMLEVDGLRDQIIGRGDPRLTFEDERSLVVRTSTYVDDRTVMLEANRAAVDIDRGVVEALRRGEPVAASLSVTDDS